MPVVLEEGAHRAWLDPAMKNAEQVGELVARHAISEVQHYRVSTRLNSAKADDEKLLERVTGN